MSGVAPQVLTFQQKVVEDLDDVERRPLLRTLTSRIPSLAAPLACSAARRLLEWQCPAQFKSHMGLARLSLDNDRWVGAVSPLACTALADLLPVSYVAGAPVPLSLANKILALSPSPLTWPPLVPAYARPEDVKLVRELCNYVLYQTVRTPRSKSLIRQLMGKM